MKTTAFNCICILSVICLIFLACGCGKQDKSSYLTVEGKPGRILKINRKNVIRADKTVRLKIAPGNHLLELSAPGYETIYRRIVVKERKKYTYAPKMKKTLSAVLIESTPSGAVVKFNGSNKGTTPLVLRDLEIGTHKAHLEMPGYAAKEISWNIKDARPLPKIKVSLDSNTVKVRINSRPEGAEVVVDDVPVGKTPFEGNFETGLHIVKLNKSGFVEITEQINLKRSTSFRKNFVLKARPGTLKIVSNPAGAIVSINGEKRGIAPLTLELDAGKHRLRLEKDGFDHTDRTITVAPAQNEEMVLTLGSATGSARFLIFPGNVALKLDGKDMGRVPMGGNGHKEVNFTKLSPGTHVLEMTHPMAKPSTRRLTFKVEKGKMYQPDEPVEIWIANCEVTYPDGRKETGALYYETPDGILFGPSPKIKFELNRNQIKGFRRLPEL